MLLAPVPHQAEMDDVEDDLYASDPLQRAKEKELDAAAKVSDMCA